MVREWSIERDDRLLKELYPDVAKKIMPYVEEACDRMEYNGSRMYDEFPDRYMIERVNEQIYEKARQMMDEEASQLPGDVSSDERQEMYGEDDIFATNFVPRGGRKPRGDFFRELVDVLMYHEMFSRRCRHNQCKRCRR